MVLTTFLIVTVAVALFSWRKTRKEGTASFNGIFFANKKLGFGAVGFGLLFTNINTTSFVGENELTYVNNMSVMAWGVTSVVAMMLVSEVIIPIYVKTGIVTTPDFLELRYDRATKSIVSIIFLANYIFNLLPGVLYGSAVAFEGLFNISGNLKINSFAAIWVLVWTIGICAALYAVFGGLKAITVSNTLLGFALFTGGILLPYFALKFLGEGSWRQGIQIILSSKTAHLNSIGNQHDSIPFSTIFTGMLLVNIYYWGTEQYIVQQALGARDLASCQKGIALASLGKLILPLLLNIPGVIAAHLYVCVPNTSTVFSKLAADTAPPIYSGFLAAILFGATLTTLVAGLNSSVTLFVLNIYNPLKEKGKAAIEKKDNLAIARKSQILIILIAILIAPFIFFATGGFYNYLQKVGGLFSVPILTIMIVGFFTKKVPAKAAKIGLVFFIVCYGCSQFLYHIQLHFLHVLALLFVITVALMLLIGRWKPMRVPFELKMNNSVSIRSWKYNRIAGMLLMLALILLFVLFSPSGLVKVK